VKTWNFIHGLRGLTIRVETDEEGWYVASVLELPGCHTQGVTLEDALGTASEAMEAVLETLREEEPERYESLMARTVTWSDRVMVSESDRAPAEPTTEEVDSTTRGRWEHAA
jgi:predicted RNase H-like HicB family nuclease